MVKRPSAGIQARATTDAPTPNNSGDCAFCTNRAIGVDAHTGKPVCRPCGVALDESEHRLVTDGGEQTDFAYDTWYDTFQASVQQFDAENGDLEAILDGDAGFHAYFHANGSDVTRGVHTAIYQALYDTLDEFYVDEELVEMRRGEVTPHAVAAEVIEQISHEHGVYLSEHVEENIRDRVAQRVETNLEDRGGTE